MKPRIIFRADGNSTIGLGHVVRSLALVEMLMNEFDCVFVIQEPSVELEKQIMEVCTSIIRLKKSSNFHEEAIFIAEHYINPRDIVVLDGYNFDTQYQKILKNKECRLVCIDDVHPYHFLSDVIINHVATIENHDYSTEYYTMIYKGPEYALLRGAFIKDDVNSVYKREGEVLICFGGSDIYNITHKALQACLKASYVKSINVVVGSAYLHLNDLQQYVTINNTKKISIFSNINATDLAKLISKSQVAICPSSTIAYEICAVKGGILTGTYVDNQRYIESFISENELGLSVGDFKASDENLIAEKLDRIIRDKEFIVHIDNQKKFFSGHSKTNHKRIFETLNSLDSIVSRRAEERDIATYFEWANDPSVRKNSINSGEIIWDDHERWFKKKISDKESFLYVFEIKGNPFGQVRFDKEDEYFRIDYSIDRNYRGKGLGTILINEAQRKIVDQAGCQIVLYAEVKSSNVASKKIFEINNFNLLDKKEVNSEEVLIFIKNVGEYWKFF